MPGSTSSPGPVLTHVIENIADGVFWLQNYSNMFPSQSTLIPLTAKWSNGPIPYHEAPAKSLSSAGQALQAELRCDPGVALHPSTSSILKGGTKNSARQYKRTVNRFGFALSLGHASPKGVLICQEMHGFFLIQKLVTVWIFSWVAWQHPQIAVRKVPTSQHYFRENGSDVVLPFLKASSFLQHLLDSYPWLLLGGLKPGDASQQLLTTFWKTYRPEHPSHEVYRREAAGEIKFGTTIPLLLHGDGARTLKKQPLEVISFQPGIGLDTLHKDFNCSCNSPARYSGIDLRDPLSLKLNSQNNSYLTHFLLAAFPSKKYKNQPGLLSSILEAISRDLGRVCQEGLVVDNTTYHFAVLGLKGDMEYHAKIGLLTRSYQNVGHRNFLPCCHECWAGAPTVPFEDFTTHASWKATVYTDAPWARDPPFQYIPYEPWSSGAAARFFRRDPFHIFRLGIGRNFIGSVVVMLCLDGVFDSPGDSRAIDARLARAWSMFSLWLHAHSLTTSGIRSFSKEKLQYPTTTSFPWCGCKGSDTVLLLKWLRFFGKLQLLSQPHSQILPLIVEGCEQGLKFQAIHRHGIFLLRGCKVEIQRSCKRFVHVYAELANIALSQNRTLYSLVPKAHAMAHIYHDLEIALRDYTVNPAFWDCSMSEDFVGRVARQSRRVSYRHTVENTLLAYKVKSKLVIQNFKKTRKL